jgi:hypothetical protein
MDDRKELRRFSIYPTFWACVCRELAGVEEGFDEEPTEVPTSGSIAQEDTRYLGMENTE